MQDRLDAPIIHDGRIRIEANWDSEAGVWVAESNDLPLVAEAPTVEAMMAKLPGIIQDLLQDEDDGQDVDIPFELISHASNSVRVRSRASVTYRQGSCVMTVALLAG
jgi:hypothetical protein